MIVDRDIGGVVVTHHPARIPIPDTAARERIGEARDEAVHRAPTGLQVDRAGGVIGIIRDRRAAEMVHGIAAPAVLVGELRPQTVDIAAATLKGQVPEHVIKRAVLEHQDDDVVDLVQVGHADLLIDHHTRVRMLPRVWRIAGAPGSPAAPGIKPDQLRRATSPIRRAGHGAPDFRLPDTSADREGR